MPYACFQACAVRDIERLGEFWKSDLRDPNEVAPPEFFIDWALSKRIHPVWLNWAISMGLYKKKKSFLSNIFLKNKNSPQVFELPAKTYSPEPETLAADFTTQPSKGDPQVFEQPTKTCTTEPETIVVDNTILTIKDITNVFDKSSTTYPPELDIAMQAWREVSATEGKGKPKTRIKAWLDANTKLSAEAKDRISIVANWNKMGGATRSD